MRLRQPLKLTGNADNRVLLVAILFLCGAAISALAKADVKSVEGLEITRVLLMGSNQLELTQGDVTLLKLRGDGDDLTPLPFAVQGDTLQLGMTPDGRERSGVKFKLTVAGLEALLVQGSGEAFVKPLSVDDLLVSLEGSGTIRMYDVHARDLEMRVFGSGALQAVDVTARDARLNLKGSGDIQLGSLQAEVIKGHMAGSGDITLEEGGEADVLEVRVMGSGDVGMKSLRAKSANVTIMGSGDVQVQVAEQLEAEILGSGDLEYYGTPEVSSSVMGSGDIVQRD